MRRNELIFACGFIFLRATMAGLRIQSGRRGCFEISLCLFSSFACTQMGICTVQFMRQLVSLTDQSLPLDGVPLGNRVRVRLLIEAPRSRVGCPQHLP